MKGIKLRLSGSVFFEKNLSSTDSLFVTIDEEKAEGGVGIFNEDITYDEEEGGAVDEES